MIMIDKRTANIGIGFRKEFAEEFLTGNALSPAFIEVAPENWMGIGGYWKKIFNRVAEKHEIFSHGLSLSLGGPDELDWEFLKNLKSFLKEYDIKMYSEHLSFARCDNAHLYDLLPVPFRWDAVQHIAQRIKSVQDFLERKIAIEIVSYYTPVAAEMSEVDFINSVVKEADCNLLLDVNNIYVNGFNHNYDTKEFLQKLSLDPVAYIHMAGHEKVADDLIIDTHGEAIIQPVYDLFDYTIQVLPKQVPVLLERDFNIPELAELQFEMNRLENICTKHWRNELVTA